MRVWGLHLDGNVSTMQPKEADATLPLSDHKPSDTAVPAPGAAAAPQSRWRTITNAVGKLWLGPLRDLIFGYDLYIAHDFDEAGAFAEALKVRLERSDRPVRCFLDREGFIIGDELGAATRRRLRMSRYLTVIITPGVGMPNSWVPTELDLFTDGGQRRMDRIAPLNV